MKISEILFLSDLDGTLLNSKKQLSELSKKTISKVISLGGGFSFATARSPDSALQYVLDLNISNPVAFYNGAKIWDPLTKQFLFSDYLNKSDAKRLVREVVTSGLNPIIHCYDHDGENVVLYSGVYNNSEESYFSDRIASSPKRFLSCSKFDMEDAIADKNVVDIVFVGHKSISNSIDTSSNTVYISEDIYSKGYFWTEIMPDSANKGVASKKIRSTGTWKYLVSFGDNINDISMFKQSDISCFVLGGNESAREFATVEIQSNENCGVANWISNTWDI